MPEAAQQRKAQRADSVSLAATSVYYALCRDVLVMANGTTAATAVTTTTTLTNTNNNSNNNNNINNSNNSNSNDMVIDSSSLVTELQHQYENLNIYLSKVLRSSFYLAAVHRLNTVAPLLHTPSLLNYVNYINTIDLFDFKLSSRLRALRNVDQLKKYFYENTVEGLLSYVTFVYTCSDADLDTLFERHQEVHRRLQEKVPAPMPVPTAPPASNSASATQPSHGADAPGVVGVANTERATTVDKIREKYEPLRFKDEKALDQVAAALKKAMATGRVNTDRAAAAKAASSPSKSRSAAAQKRRKQVAQLVVDAVRLTCLLTIQSYSFHYLFRALLVYYLRTEVEWEVVLRFGLTVNLKVQEYYDGDMEEKFAFAERMAIARQQRCERRRAEGGEGDEEEEGALVCGAQLFVPDPADATRLVEIRDEQYDRVDDLIGDVVARRYHDEEELVNIREGITSQRVLNAVRFRCQDVNRRLYYIYGLDQAEKTAAAEPAAASASSSPKKSGKGSQAPDAGKPPRPPAKLLDNAVRTRQIHERSLDGLYLLLGHFVEQAHAKNHEHYSRHGGGTNPPLSGSADSGSAYTDFLLAGGSSSGSPTLAKNSSAAVVSSPSMSGGSSQQQQQRCSVSSGTTVPFAQSRFAQEWHRIVRESKNMDPKQFNDFTWTADAAPQSRIDSTIRARGTPSAPPPARTNSKTGAPAADNPLAAPGAREGSAHTPRRGADGREGLEEGEVEQLDEHSRMGSYYASPIQTYKGDYAMHHNAKGDVGDRATTPSPSPPPAAEGGPAKKTQSGGDAPRAAGQQDAAAPPKKKHSTGRNTNKANAAQSEEASGPVDFESAIFSEDDQGSAHGDASPGAAPPLSMSRRAGGGSLAQSTHISSSFESTYQRMKKSASAKNGDSSNSNNSNNNNNNNNTSEFEDAIQFHEALFQKYSEQADATELQILTLLHHHENNLFLSLLKHCVLCVINAHEDGWDGRSAAVPPKKSNSGVSTAERHGEEEDETKSDVTRPPATSEEKSKGQKKKEKDNVAPGGGVPPQADDEVVAPRSVEKAEKKKGGCACVLM